MLDENQQPNPQPVLTHQNRVSQWYYLFVTLGILQALGVALFFLIMSWAIQQAKAGVSGTEFIGLILFTTLVPIVGIIALINLIGLPIYIRKHKPRGKGLAFSILSLLISVILFSYGSYSAYQTWVVAPNQLREFAEQSKQESELKEQRFATDNANPEISKDEAITLLKACQLKGFYYTKETVEEHGTTPATSSTGIVLTKVSGKPHRISIANRLISELVPIAREAQKICSGPQFWHDGAYEQYQDGKWYFKNKVVNSGQ